MCGVGRLQVIDVPAAEKIAADGTPKTQIGEEITVKLGYRFPITLESDA